MELVDDTDGSAFLERELVGLGVDGYRWVRVHDCASGMVPIYTFRDYCISRYLMSRFMVSIET